LLALLVISGFGRVRRKIYVDAACKLQVYIDKKEREQLASRMGEAMRARVLLLPSGEIGKDETDGYKAPRS